MGLTKLALKRPVSLLMCVICVLVLGFSAITGMPMELTPPMEFPMFIVNTVYPTAAPEDVEKLVSKPIEDALGTVSGVKNITSISQENVSMVLLELDYNTNLDEVSTAIQEKLNQVKSSLPDEANAPSAMRMSQDNSTVSLISITSDTYDNLGNFVEQEIAPQFEKLAGVAGTQIIGAKEQYIQVALKDNKISQYNLTSDMVAQLISLTDLNIPAGSIERGDQKLLLRGQVQYSSIEQLKAMPITLASGDVITVEDIADVSLQTEKITSVSRRNGANDITLYVNKMQDANTVDVSEAVRDTAKEITNANQDIEVNVVIDQGEYITSAITSVAESLIAGAIISMVVLWFFLGDIKASLIIATSIPFSVILTFVIMGWAGININLVSMGGLVVGVGMIVDNSIVVLESMYRKRAEDFSYYDSAKEGVKIVVSAIVASTLTTIVVFLPISLINGLTGQLFSQVGFTVIFSLTASLISALTLVPALFVKIQPKEKVEGKSLAIIQKLNNAYSRAIRKVLRVKKTVLTTACILLVLSIALVPIIGLELMPQMDQGEVSVSLKGKNGLTVREIDKYLVQVENIIKEMPDVEEYTTTGQDGGSGSVTAYLKKDRELSTKECENYLREQTQNIIGVDVTVSQGGSGMGSMGGGGSISVELQGRDIEKLTETANSLVKVMENNPSLNDPKTSLSDGSPEAKIIVDPLKSASYGLNPATVISSVSTVINGKAAATYSINGNSYDVKVEVPRELYNTIDDLSGINIKSPAGTYVPLFDMATVEFENGPTMIQRKNSQYIVSVSAQVTDGNAYAIQSQLIKDLKSGGLPAGVEINQGGENAMINKEFTEIIKAMFLAIALVFMIMAGQFESIWFSLIVMATVPFSAIGALFTLFAFGKTISMVSLIGCIILVGTVINNSIVLIDYTGQLRDQGMPIREALI
ncbi:MAG: efflux RND transporter permease subunit, partial [Oscillospiraceae bacterium]